MSAYVEQMPFRTVGSMYEAVCDEHEPQWRGGMRAARRTASDDVDTHNIEFQHDHKWVTNPDGPSIKFYRGDRP